MNTAACPTANKTPYPSRCEANAALRRMSPKYKANEPYQCVCGAWHVGRQHRRRTAAWR